MSVYVDDVFPASWGRGYTQACHMRSDTEEELHAFALRLGLRRSWAQHPGTGKSHYDLTPNKRALALRYGASCGLTGTAAQVHLPRLQGCGEVVRTAMIAEADRAGYLIEFLLGGRRYRLMWPVLQPRDGDVKAARRQSATALFHDVKARCVAMKFLGGQAAFLPFLELSDGRVAAQLGEDAGNRLPLMLSRPALVKGKGEDT